MEEVQSHLSTDVKKEEHVHGHNHHVHESKIEIKEEIIHEAKPEIKQEVELEPIPDKETEKNLLEFGEYRMFGPDNGDIMIDRIELKSVSGAHRIWKVKSLDKKQVSLEVIKFG